MIDLIIKNAYYVFTMNEERQVIKDGAVAINGSKILKVGKNDDIFKKYGDAKKIIDARDSIVMPGMINCHLHTTQQLARGLGDNVFLPSYTHGRIFPYEAALTEDDVYYSAMCACMEAIKTGTTCLVDPGGYHMEKVVDAVEKIGIRAILKRSMIDLQSGDSPVPGKMLESTKNALQAGEDFVSRYNGYANGRIRTWFSMRTERTSSTELLKGTKILADKYRVGIGSHVSCFFTSVASHKEMFDGKTPLVRFNEAGVLGPNLMIYHGNYITDKELDLIVENDVKVVHCPTTGFALGCGAMHGRHVDMLERGVTVALGTDSASASNSNDMFRAAYSLTAHRDVKRDVTVLTNEEILEIAITNGAKAALWEDEIGAIEEGKKADIIILNTIGPDWIPIHNPVSNTIMSASSGSVSTVIIDGKIVMEERKIKTVHEEEILREGQKRAIDIAKRSGLDVHARMKWPEE